MGVLSNGTQERVSIVLIMGFTRPPFLKGKRWSMEEGLQAIILLLCMLPVPQSSSPTLRRAETDFRNGFGGNSRGLNYVTGVIFSVEQGGTLALCDLSFSTN